MEMKVRRKARDVRCQHNIVLVTVIGIHLNFRVHQGEDQRVLPLPAVVYLKMISRRDFTQECHIIHTGQSLAATRFHIGALVEVLVPDVNRKIFRSFQSPAQLGIWLTKIRWHTFVIER